MVRAMLMAVFAVVAAVAGWLGYQTGQWHYLSAFALGPLLWIATRT